MDNRIYLQETSIPLIKDSQQDIPNLLSNFYIASQKLTNIPFSSKSKTGFQYERIRTVFDKTGHEKQTILNVEFDCS